MLLLGIDLGTSSIKVSLVDGATRQTLATTQFPDSERSIISLQTGWAEQDPELWWEDVKAAVRRLHQTGKFKSADIGAIGISYQMHGLVLVGKDGKALRNSIIWCDSRAIPYGDEALQAMGADYCLQHLLNAPGNFTAAKLAWVKVNEPDIFGKIYKILLPGDYIAQRLTGTMTTTPSALSEGIFWDFTAGKISERVMDYFGFPDDIIPDIQPVCSDHGRLTKAVAEELSLTEGIPVCYKAGDQLNNALSLNVMEPGEVAATAGTSGVIYGISDQLTFDPQSRINSFAHVNHGNDLTRVGVLLCINGTGILNKWIRQLTGAQDYETMNDLAQKVAPGSEGLAVFPFGNGAERMLNNKMPGAGLQAIDLNQHSAAHVIRASQEGIAFAFRYGLDIMRANGMAPAVIRAGRANMFLSPVFAEAFVNATNIPIELCDNNGSVGAALGAGIGYGYFKTPADAFLEEDRLEVLEPTRAADYEHWYQSWKEKLERQLMY
ncbi:xylulokinase [Niabella insulamsoli]|uniref:xylulokinase n=1 Tax=Niabella insulamsoli TaxID=3144874 RepID=UPI0031FC688E